MNMDESKKIKDIEEKEESLEKKEENHREETPEGKTEEERKIEIKRKVETREPRPEKSEQDEAKSFRSRLRKRDAEIKNLKREKEDLKDKYLRVLAEMENLRKRLDREKKEYYQYALSEFLKELLLILDNFERAFKNKGQAEGTSFQEGIEMIYKQFTDLLAKNGVRPIAVDSKKFDPNVHQAVLTEESEHVQEPEVSEELQKGYSLHDRLLRPTLVKVSIPKKS
ncbi:MAG: nucleotide exchange factor GrpE [Candidatus Aminicenantales bacterium]